MERVVISEPTEQENITLEQQAAMQEEAKQATETESQEVETAQEEPQQEERPEWLDPKFENPEELAKAYKELQKKQSSRETKNEKTSSKDNPSVDSVIAQATESYEETGEVSPEMYQALEKAGIPSEFVSAYVAGQEAIATSQTTEVQDSIGGTQNYDAMTEWASENLSDSDIEAYDDVVTNGTLEQAKMAAQGMYARFTAGGGKAPSLTQGNTSGDSSQPFTSAHQVTQAMRDPRYKHDPAYRQSVERRIAVSNVL
tara:strand:+ start:623 stop:1393 length:771 start_codon:yes stop_codon:yes gene_type:complete